MTLPGKTENDILTDHAIAENLQNQRDSLSEKWKDNEIYDCTDRAAELVLYYMEAEKRPTKSYVRVGRILFYWNQAHADQLNCLIEEEKIRLRLSFSILDDARLHYDGLFYLSPQDFIDCRIKENNLFYKRATATHSLKKVLERNFDDESSLFYPPNYPPLLVAIAIANNNLATAMKVIRHPYIDDANSDRFRLKHLLSNAIDAALEFGREDFADYLIQEYGLLNPEKIPTSTLIASAIRYSRRPYALKLIDLYPDNLLQDAAAEAIMTAVETQSTEMLQWAVNQLLPKLTGPMRIPNKKEAVFLCRLFLFGKREIFFQVAAHMPQPLPWNSVYEELLRSGINPQDFLELCPNVESLPKDTHALLLLRCAVINDDQKLEKYLHQYPWMKEALNLAVKKLLESLNEIANRENVDLASESVHEKLVRRLIAAGATPKLDHFADLLQHCFHAQIRHRFFQVLLAGINSVEEARENLVMSSAFGEEAMQAVLTKFPELASDQGFIKKLIEHTWKGAILAADKLKVDLVSPSRAAVPTASSAAAARNIGQLPVANAAISMEILVDIWLPQGDIDKIAAELPKNPNLISEFWYRCLFIWDVNFITPQWKVIASTTINQLPVQERNELFKNGFYYFNRSLLQLLLESCKDLDGDLLLECFNRGLRSRDVQLIDVLAEANQLGVSNAQGDTLMHAAARDNSWWMIRRLIEKGAILDRLNAEGLTPAELTLQFGGLTSFSALQGEGWVSDLVVFLEPYPVEELKTWLQKAFLNSSSHEFWQLLQSLRERFKHENAYQLLFDELDAFARYPGTLISRFPSHIEQEEAFTGYGQGYKSYVEQQFAWGQRCEELYQQFYEEFQGKSHGLLAALIEFAKPRAALKGYEVWRMGYVLEGTELATHFHGRYFYYWRLAMQIYYDFLKNPERYQDALVSTDQGYRVTYKPDNEQPLILSTINLKGPYPKGRFKAHMQHTSVKNLKLVLPYLSNLFNEIKSYPLEQGSKVMPGTLKKKIALFYWLGAHNTITERGNAQYMLMMHRLLYNMHGFQAPPWSPIYVLPDCIAIIMPFEKFYQEYYDKLFDPSFTHR